MSCFCKLKMWSAAVAVDTSVSSARRQQGEHQNVDGLAVVFKCPLGSVDEHQ